MHLENLSAYVHIGQRDCGQKEKGKSREEGIGGEILECLVGTQMNISTKSHMFLNLLNNCHL